MSGRAAFSFFRTRSKRKTSGVIWISTALTFTLTTRTKGSKLVWPPKKQETKANSNKKEHLQYWYLLKPCCVNLKIRQTNKKIWQLLFGEQKQKKRTKSWFGNSWNGQTEEACECLKILLWQHLLGEDLLNSLLLLYSRRQDGQNKKKTRSYFRSLGNSHTEKPVDLQKNVQEFLENKKQTQTTSILQSRFTFQKNKKKMRKQTRNVQK